MRTIDRDQIANATRSNGEKGTHPGRQREDNVESAGAVWPSAIGNSHQGNEAYGQSASYFERKARPPEKALEIVGEALAELCSAAGDDVVQCVPDNAGTIEPRGQRLEGKTQSLPQFS